MKSWWATYRYAVIGAGSGMLLFLVILTLLWVALR